MFCNKFLSQTITADSIISRILEHVTSNMKHNGISTGMCQQQTASKASIP